MPPALRKWWEWEEWLPRRVIAMFRQATFLAREAAATAPEVRPAGVYAQATRPHFPEPAPCQSPTRRHVRLMVCGQPQRAKPRPRQPSASGSGLPVANKPSRIWQGYIKATASRPRQAAQTQTAPRRTARARPEGCLITLCRAKATPCLFLPARFTRLRG